MDQTLGRIFKLILTVIIVGFVIWFLFKIRSTVTLLIISLLLAYILDPVASYFEYRGLSRTQSTVIIFLFIAICFMILGIVAVFLWYRSAQKTSVTFLKPLPKDGDMVLNDIHHESTRHGVKEWAIDAGRAVYLNAENNVLFDNISMTFFLKDGETVLLTGRKGVLNTETQDMKITGNVVARGKVYEVSTEALSYLHQERIIYSTDPFLLVGDAIRLTGHGMQFDFDTGKLNVQERVIADIRLETKFGR